MTSLLAAIGCGDPTASDSRDWIAAIDVGQAGVDAPKLVLVRLDGTGMRTLASPADHAEWLPDGESLVYHAGTPEAFHLYVVNSSSGSSRRLLPENSPVAQQYYPIPSPDGRWIYFHGGEGLGSYDTEFAIYRVRPDGTGLEKVLVTPLNATYRPYSVSPDGRTLLMERGGWLVALDVASGQVHEYGIPVRFARYSPNGRQIAFVGRLEGDSYEHVYVMAPDGRGIRRVSHPEQVTWYEAGLAWSPDGRLLIARAAGGLHEINVQTTRTTPMAPWTMPMFYLSWRPR